MKIKLFLFLMLSLVSICFAQPNTFNKETELQKFIEQGGKVNIISTNEYRLTYRSGESRTFYLNRTEKSVDNKERLDTTIVNFSEIDTTLFNNMFTFRQQVQVNNGNWAPLPIKDLNENGLPELYGFSDVIRPKNVAGPVKIFEKNLSGNYREVFNYDSTTVLVKAIGDINGNDKKEILIASTIDDGGTFFYPIYKCDSTDTLPTTFDFFFYLDTLQINNMIIDDFDNNGITDCVFTTPSIWDTTMCVIAEYRDSINNFEEIFQFSSIFESDLSGFAIDDFDQDGKIELAVSSGPGNVFIIENTNENDYSVTNQFPFPVPNAYMQTVTKDIDGNGKPEFWIGGQDFVELNTVFQCYEADGNNSYKAVARIDIRNYASFTNENIQALDVDGDGREELVISIGNAILILKFSGSANNHKYDLWYAKIGEATQPGAQFYPAAFADFDKDNKKDLLIPMRKYTPSITYFFSYILKQNGTTDLELIDSDYITSQDFITSYPVPFNSTSSIRFAISEENYVKIKVYNSLGREIKILLKRNLTPGKYNIKWEARDKYGSPLSSGIYFFSLQTQNSLITTKTIFLK